MTAPRDDHGDRVRAAEVTDPWDATSGDRVRQPHRTLTPGHITAAARQVAAELQERWRVYEGGDQ